MTKSYKKPAKNDIRARFFFFVCIIQVRKEQGGNPMKTAKRKWIYSAVILLFILSFGYFILWALYGLAESIYACCAPLREWFNAGVLQAIRHDLSRCFSGEAIIVPTLTAARLSVVLSVLILFSSLQDDIFLSETAVETAIAPLVLALGYGIVWVLCIALPTNRAFSKILICCTVLVVFIAYAVLFFTAIQRSIRITREIASLH